MGRIHLFEFEDQSWCPRVLRDAATAYLRRAMEVSGQVGMLVPKVAEALRTSGERRIVDLCSGGGGPVPGLLDDLAADGLEVEARLTDFYPSVDELRAAAESDARVSFEPEPVDATAVTKPLGGLRTLFNGFHHFRPAAAGRILASSVAAREAIGIFELVGRRPLMLLGILFAPLAVLVLMPTMRPKPSWLFFTYLVPLVPLLVLWDGVVSCLRVYSVEELKALVSDLDAPGWRWDVGQFRLGASPAYATYLIGYPPES